MGLFRLKKEKKREALSISGEQLCMILKEAIRTAADEVEAKYYITGPEIMFEYKDNLHFAGIKYDKKRAKQEKRELFSKELLSLYVDKATYTDLKELHANAVVDHELLKDITDGIIVSPEYKRLLEKMSDDNGANVTK